MADNDSWGADPAVQRTRALFSRMEAMDSRLIGRAEVNRFNPRLRAARKKRLEIFEIVMTAAGQNNIALDETSLMELFVLSHVKAFSHFKLPAPVLSQAVDPILSSLFEKVSSNAS